MTRRPWLFPPNPPWVGNPSIFPLAERARARSPAALRGGIDPYAIGYPARAEDTLRGEAVFAAWDEASGCIPKRKEGA